MTARYEGGHQETAALRRDNNRWCAFDSSPLVASDTLIWPGENGLLYTIRLNTAYDPQVGTLSVRPDTPVCARYSTARSGAERYWYGFEDSAVVVGHYLYLSENGGMFFCVDLNTMELVWAQDTKDDSNSTPVFEAAGESGGYLYTAPSLHWTAQDGAGTVSVYKLDAVTGEILWEAPYDCRTVEGVSGGVQSSPLLGSPGTALEGKILYTVARTPDEGNGLLVALDTATGKESWRMVMDSYAWSSPAAFTAADGTVRVVVCDSVGRVFLLDGGTGQVLDTADAGSLVEASPAIYGNRLVVGTRGQKIWCMELG